MKNKISGVVFIIAIAVLATINIKLTKSENSNVNIELANVEALAGEWNDWTQWGEYGFTKDEREIQEQCPNQQSSGAKVCIKTNSAGACIEWANSQSGTAGRTDIRCGTGTVNCRAVKC